MMRLFSEVEMRCDGVLEEMKVEEKKGSARGKRKVLTKKEK